MVGTAGVQRMNPLPEDPVDETGRTHGYRV